MTSPLKSQKKLQLALRGNKILVILGPTASGKSDLAIQLAKKLKGEVISADSRQVYRGMDIGTGKVTKREQRIVPHRLLDIADPKRDFSVARYKKLAQKILCDIQKRSKLPIIVGGTGLYIDALLNRVSWPEVPPNKKLRAKLAKQSTEQLFKQLQKLDPRRAKSIDPHNKHRLIRALEIVVGTGKPVPVPLKGASASNVTWIGINPGKEELARNIEKRLTARLGQGMLNEVRKLHRSGVSWKRLGGFGLEYRWIARYLQKKISEQEMRAGLLRDIVRYSKRQMMWFKRNKEIRWFTTAQHALRALSRERLLLS
ncbi:MAG: tRNA (adenosine(37)-N6)-dimethylallyltransferase MiaA [Patescibacteria group bacterium]